MIGQATRQLFTCCPIPEAALLSFNNHFINIIVTAAHSAHYQTPQQTRPISKYQRPKTKVQFPSRGSTPNAFPSTWTSLSLHRSLVRRRPALHSWLLRLPRLPRLHGEAGVSSCDVRAVPMLSATGRSDHGDILLDVLVEVADVASNLLRKVSSALSLARREYSRATA